MRPAQGTTPFSGLRRAASRVPGHRRRAARVLYPRSAQAPAPRGPQGPAPLPFVAGFEVARQPWPPGGRRGRCPRWPPTGAVAGPDPGLTALLVESAPTRKNAKNVTQTGAVSGRFVSFGFVTRTSNGSQIPPYCNYFAKKTEQIWTPLFHLHLYRK